MRPQLQHHFFQLSALLEYSSFQTLDGDFSTEQVTCSGISCSAATLFQTWKCLFISGMNARLVDNICKPESSIHM